MPRWMSRLVHAVAIAVDADRVLVLRAAQHEPQRHVRRARDGVHAHAGDAGGDVARRARRAKFVERRQALGDRDRRERAGERGREDQLDEREAVRIGLAHVHDSGTRDPVEPG